jgi:hypothetical protein
MKCKRCKTEIYVNTYGFWNCECRKKNLMPEADYEKLNSNFKDEAIKDGL